MAKSKSSQGASGARRKPAPSLYLHISSFKPQFSTRVDDVLHFSKTLTWRSEIIPDKSKGTLTTSLLYSQGSDIYEIDTTLPLKTFYDDDDDDDHETPLIARSTKLPPAEASLQISCPIP